MSNAETKWTKHLFETRQITGYFFQKRGRDSRPCSCFEALVMHQTWAGFRADSLTCIQHVRSQPCGVCISTGLAVNSPLSAHRMYTSHPVWFCYEMVSAGRVCLWVEYLMSREEETGMYWLTDWLISVSKDALGVILVYWPHAVEEVVFWYFQLCSYLI